MNGFFESAHLARDLHLLLQAGMPVPEALARIQARSKGRWGVAVRKARDAAAAGTPLAAALRKAQGFPRLLVDGLDAAAEELPLQRLSELLERADLRQRQTAIVLAYPLMLLIAGLALVLLLSTTVGQSIPKFLSEINTQLPLLSRITLNFLELINNPAVLVLLLAAVAGFGWVLYGSGPAAAWRLRVPLIGSWIRRSETATWLDWADYYLDQDRPLPEALRRAALACQDLAFRQRAEAAAADAERGQDVKTALQRQGMVDELALWLMAQGEVQEFPPHYLSRASQLLQRELDADAEGGLACLEVASLLVISVVLFPMIMSLFLPIYNLMGSL
ncbi:MAG: type II secretion system F family protein [Candidatus Eremiobacteraeota bacterium]|nr:type II secretion system F family protein [Candidatus Eremiobacteraeota bacterium]MCW5869666.1 type II secretion system F family protein [Candidatus Eremiobacteraeota bacterium]